MSWSVLTGAVSGLSAVGLMLLGLLLLLPASLRFLFVIRRPDRGRFAKATASFGLCLLLFGMALFLASDLSSDYPGFRHALDAATPVLAGLSFVLGAFAAVRAGRRRSAPAAAEEPPAPETSTPADPPG